MALQLRLLNKFSIKKKEYQRKEYQNDPISECDIRSYSNFFYYLFLIPRRLPNI